MILSMSGQAWLFLSTVAIGFVMGFFYDVFRILRKTVPHRHWAVQLEDILYWAGVTFIIFYFMLHRNYGEVRFFSIAGAAVGMVIYFNSLSVLILKVSLTVIQFLQRVFLTAARIVLAPVRLLFRLFVPPGKWLYRFARRVLSARLRTLYRNIFVVFKKV